MTKTIHTSVAVIGGGSAGFAAALRAGRAGLNTVLVEREAQLGGTSNLAGVNCYEPVKGAIGIASELFERLSAHPNECGIYRINRHFCVPEMNVPPFPGCEQTIDPNATYSDTLRSWQETDLRTQFSRRRGIVFEPEALQRVMSEMLKETGHCQVLTNSAVSEVEYANRRIDAVLLNNGCRLNADLWIDCCGVVAQKSKCRCLFGRDSRAEFNEPDAPEVPDRRLNGVSRLFRLTPCKNGECDEAFPADIPTECYWSANYPPMVATYYPNGDINCNMLPTMSGEEYFNMTEAEALIETERRVWSYWRFLRLNYPEFRYFRLHSIFPRIGLREGMRVECRYMLNENDIISGLDNCRHRDIIAQCDHPMDLHGIAAPSHSGGVYGIPFRSLCPVAFDNMLAAGRIAGFSALAASSCRLSRTMMRLGEAAGAAAVLVQRANCRDFSEIDGAAVAVSMNEYPNGISKNSRCIKN
ncbi:MAG: FAD-dependent oxidoreductase [Victivallales bacterium]|nr:FAD-dependent oxidoreductase [Victivallales bacterium]